MYRSDPNPIIGNMEMHTEPVPSAHAHFAQDIATYELATSLNMQTNAVITGHQCSEEAKLLYKLIRGRHEP